MGSSDLADGGGNWNPVPFEPTGWTLLWFLLIGCAIVVLVGWWLWRESKKY